MATKILFNQILPESAVVTRHTHPYKISNKSLVFGSTIILLLLSACHMPGVIGSETASIEPSQTTTAVTASTQVTQSSTSATSITDTVPPTATSSPTITPTSTLTETPTPDQTDTPEAIETVPPLEDFRVILDDDFTSGTGWFEDEGQNFGFTYTEDGYLIFVNLLKATIWSIRDIERQDIRLEVTAEQIAGSDDGYYGVTYRHQDEDNYYALVISNDSRYGVARMLDGTFEFIAEGVAQEGWIEPEGDNLITADCIDGNLTLYANNFKLIEVLDDSFSKGVYGLVAGTRLNEGNEVVFKRIVAMAP